MNVKFGCTLGSAVTKKATVAMEEKSPEREEFIKNSGIAATRVVHNIGPTDGLFYFEGLSNEGRGRGNFEPGCNGSAVDETTGTGSAGGRRGTCDAPSADTDTFSGTGKSSTNRACQTELPLDIVPDQRAGGVGSLNSEKSSVYSKPIIMVKFEARIYFSTGQAKAVINVSGKHVTTVITPLSIPTRYCLFTSWWRKHRSGGAMSELFSLYLV